MARTKQTARRSDDKGNLPPLAPARRDPTKWGSAKQTFLRHVVLPEVQKKGARQGVTRSSTRVSELVTVYSTVHEIGSKESKDITINAHRMYSTVHSIGSTESKDVTINAHRMYSTVHSIGLKESKEQTRCKYIQFIYLHACCYIAFKTAPRQIHCTCGCNA